MGNRLKMTARNAFWSYFSMGVSFVLQFISRTVFIYYLGEGYLGINGLFTNVLGVLSFAELGIGTAINFSLYKPVAEQNIEKIKAYMFYYKWAYRIIALIVSILGCGSDSLSGYFGYRSRGCWKHYGILLYLFVQYGNILFCFL